MLEILATIAIEDGYWLKEDVYEAIPALEPGPKIIEADGFKYDENLGNKIETPEGIVELTPTELKLFIDLISHYDTIRTHYQLAQSAEYDDFVVVDYVNNVRTHIVGLRKKLGDIKNHDNSFNFIHREKGIGYRFKVRRETTLPQS